MLVVLAGILVLAVVWAGGREWVDGQSGAETAGPPLERGKTVAQTFRAAGNGLMAVDLQLASYARRADGTVDVMLLDRSGAGLAIWRLDAGRVVDNAWHRFKFPAPRADQVGTPLTLLVRRPEAGGAPVTVWTTAGNAYPDGRMSIDGAPTGGDIAFRAVYRPGWRSGARLLLASTGYPPVIGTGLLFGLLASAFGLLSMLFGAEESALS
jgi:hypothetical protein